MVLPLALCHDGGVRVERRGVALVLATVCGCTEANPFADGDTSTSAADGSTTLSDSTGPTTMPGDTSSATATDESSTNGTNDPTTDTTGETACPLGTHVCVAAAPEGWSGPVALIGDTPEDPEPECAAPFPAAGTVAYGELVAPPADCTCECGNPSGAACVRTIVRDNNAGCGSPTQQWQLAVQDCTKAISGTGSQYWQATTGPITGNCTETATDEVVDAAFAERETLCAADEASAGACTGTDVCTPIPIAPFTADALCIWADGDLECPMDLGYDTRRVLFRDLLDTRGCSGCSCTIAGECTGAVYLFGIDGCDADFVAATLTFDGACQQVASTITAAELTGSWDVDASCQSNGGEPEGAAAGVDPVTICCR